QLYLNQPYTEGTMPLTFYIEGTNPSAYVGEIYFTITYRQNGMLDQSYEATLTVTPVITDFEITTGHVIFVNDTNGLDGLIAAGVPYLNGEAGVVFSATAEVQGLSGSLVFVQNLAAVVNGVDGSSGGATYNDSTTQNFVVNPNLPPNEQHTFPFLDRGTDAPPAEYDADVNSQTINGSQKLTADDNPITRPPNRASLTAVGEIWDFYIWLAWQFNNPNSGSNLYPLAYASWDVNFGATNYQAGQGVTQISAGAGVFFGGWQRVPYTTFPITTNVIANKAFIWQQGS
ncbi:MAG TPA: hypothetical protein VFA18_24910, partial [Gemmataceae bacterium]|nr:hypothetical protein [Gemmataceae bacterium]